MDAPVWFPRLCEALGGRYHSPDAAIEQVRRMTSELRKRIDRDAALIRCEEELYERFGYLLRAESRDLAADVKRLTAERDAAREELFNLRIGVTA